MLQRASLVKGVNWVIIDEVHRSQYMLEKKEWWIFKKCKMFLKGSTCTFITNKITHHENPSCMFIWPSSSKIISSSSWEVADRQESITLYNNNIFIIENNLDIFYIMYSFWVFFSAQSKVDVVKDTNRFHRENKDFLFMFLNWFILFW